MQPRRIFGSTTSDTLDLEQMVSEAQIKTPPTQETQTEQMVSEAQAKTPPTQETQTEQSPGLDSILGNLIGRGLSLSGATPDMPSLATPGIPGLGSLASNRSVSDHLGSSPPQESDTQEQTEAQSPVVSALEQIAPGPEQEEESS